MSKVQVLPKRLSPIHEQLSDWFVKEGDGVVMQYEIIARQLKKFRDHSPHPKAGLEVTQEDLSRAIARVRFDLETRHKTTLYNFRGIGYKVCNPDELALYTAKFFKRTILYADRTYRLVDIVDRHRIPAALKKVFLDNEGRIKSMSLKGKHFMKLFVEYLKEQKKLEGGETNGEAKTITSRNGQKRLAHQSQPTA